MNAQEMLKDITETRACEGIEDWLKDKLLPRMRNSANLSVNVDSSSIKWSNGAFMRDMQNLGYAIESKCDDRPCALPYYKISIYAGRFYVGAPSN